MKWFQNWFSGLSMKKRLLVIVLPILVPLIAVVELLTTPSSGRVLAEGKNLGEFEASSNPFKFDAADAQRFVITKVEVFEAGQLNGFPADCSGGDCPYAPDNWPIVIVSTKVDPACKRGPPSVFLACVSVLSAQCGLGEEALKPPTYIWWERDSAGHRKPHSCAYAGIEHPSGLILLGFFPHVRVPPTRLSLVVQGRDVPIHLKS